MGDGVFELGLTSFIATRERKGYFFDVSGMAEPAADNM
jgi:hypothetical protein